MKQGKL